MVANRPTGQPANRPTSPPAVIANRIAVKQSMGTEVPTCAPWIATPFGLAMTGEKGRRSTGERLPLRHCEPHSGEAIHGHGVADMCPMDCHALRARNDG